MTLYRVGAAPLLPAHHRRRPPVLRRPQLPLHRRQTRPQLFRRPRHARPRRALDARCHLIKPQRLQIPDQLPHGYRQGSRRAHQETVTQTALIYLMARGETADRLNFARYTAAHNQLICARADHGQFDQVSRAYSAGRAHSDHGPDGASTTDRDVPGLLRVAR